MRQARAGGWKLDLYVDWAQERGSRASVRRDGRHDVPADRWHTAVQDWWQGDRAIGAADRLGGNGAEEVADTQRARRDSSGGAVERVRAIAVVVVGVAHSVQPSDVVVAVHSVSVDVVDVGDEPAAEQCRALVPGKMLNWKWADFHVSGTGPISGASSRSCPPTAYRDAPSLEERRVERVVVVDAVLIKSCIKTALDCPPWTRKPYALVARLGCTKVEESLWRRC